MTNLRFKRLTTVARWMALAVAIETLAGCAPLVLGAAAGGALVATDRRTSGTQLEDQGIEIKAANRLRDALGGRGHINTTAYNRKVLLTGEVPSEADKQVAEQTVARIENTQSVINELAVMGNSSLSERSNDVWIASKIKATYVDAKDMVSNAFTVVVERGDVYLLGMVTEREGKRAAELAAGVKGVNKVVKLFQTLTEEELANKLPSPPPASTSGNK